MTHTIDERFISSPMIDFNVSPPLGADLGGVWVHANSKPPSTRQSTSISEFANRNSKDFLAICRTATTVVSSRRLDTVTSLVVEFGSA